jgi:hypothetical protein
MILLLSNHGHPDERFNEYVQRASQFYAEQLFPKQLLRHIVVSVKFNKHLDAFGYTSVEKRNSKGKAREFLIELHPYITGKEILKTLAHEFVHVKQYAYEELNEEQTQWQGEPFDSDAVDYYELPWEIEAHGHEIGLFTNFAKKESLWNVLENVYNPDTPVEPVPLGWKDENQFSKAKRPTVATASEGHHLKELSKLGGKGCEVNIDGGRRRRRAAIRSWFKKLRLFNRM